MATFRQAAARAGASPQVAAFLQRSFRPSSLATYSSAWRAWSQWCREQGLGDNSPSVSRLLQYLLHLFDKGRVYGSLGVHRSAISSITGPGDSPALGAHPLISRFMRAAFLARPPAALTLRPTWDVAEVLQHLMSWDAPQDLDLPLLSQKTVMLVALESMRRISDLCLLDISEGHMASSQNKIVFQLKFGLKQDRPNHSSPVVEFKASSVSQLCALAHLREYLDRVAPLRSSTALFVTTTPPHKQAARHTIRAWVLRVLAGAGISHAAGSTRAAAASFAAASRTPLKSILRKGDWSRANTLFRHYVRHLPHSSLQRLAETQSDNG